MIFWAGAAYGPFCGLIPLPHIVADRYLYFVLPGLIGGCLLVLQDCAPFTARLLARFGLADGPARTLQIRLAALLAVLLCLSYSSQARERSGVWTSEQEVMDDAIRNYPDGKIAKHADKVATLTRAEAAARAGKNAEAITELRSLHARGFDAIDLLLFHPAFVPLISDPDYRALLREIGQKLFRDFEGKRELSQYQYQQIGLSYFVHGELDAAEGALMRALEIGGPGDADVQTYLMKVRAQRFGSPQ